MGFRDLLRWGGRAETGCATLLKKDKHGVTRLPVPELSKQPGGLKKATGAPKGAEPTREMPKRNALRHNVRDGYNRGRNNPRGHGQRTGVKT